MIHQLTRTILNSLVNNLVTVPITGAKMGVMMGVITTLSMVNTASADTVQLDTEYTHHAIKEGYSGDIDQLQLDVLARRNQDNSQTALPQAARDLDSRHGGDVNVIDVLSSVYSDFDHDGYYSRFTLNLDIDNRYGYEYVYVKIYLARNHNPYTLFHVTDVFEIYSDLSSDRYKVESKLKSNFPAGHYNVKLDVFIAGQTGLQDSVDASTDRSLYALPLESERLDGGSRYDDVLINEYSGAFSPLTILILALLGFAIRGFRGRPRAQI